MSLTELVNKHKVSKVSQDHIWSDAGETLLGYFASRLLAYPWYQGMCSHTNLSLSKQDSAILVMTDGLRSNKVNNKCLNGSLSNRFK